MHQIIISIDCDGELFGGCRHNDLRFNCELFGVSLCPTSDYKPKRCDACLRAELLVNEKLYSVKDFIVL